ncbi:hypothetical protein [Priestia aryabhattai]|uniref:hypothetical protein n=1 Tax=Priestia aryabhattai TaxID=412384 RepID=UPI003D2D1D7F
MVISSVVAFQRLDSQGIWTELLIAPGKHNEIYPDIVLNQDDVKQPEDLKGEKIRFEALEIDRNEDLVQFHCWEIKKWRMSHSRFIILHPKVNVRYYTEKTQDKIEIP